jgi:hypothetical protein
MKHMALRSFLLALLCWQIMGCNSHATVETEADLARQVNAAVSPNTSTESALATLTSQGFLCNANNRQGTSVCRRKVSGLVCAQVQWVYLPLSSKDVGQLKTKLDLICL